MTEPNRYAVPLDRLDGVRVAETEQVQEQTPLAAPQPTWSGQLGPAYGDGAGTDADGE